MIEKKTQFQDDDCPPPDLSPLYGRTYAKNKNHIIYVENEESIHAIYTITENYGKDIGAVTGMGGAGNFKNTDWRPLAGKTVYLWPNNNQPNDNGKRTSIDHMKEIQKILKRLNPAPKIFWINPYELDLKPDGSPLDFFEKYEDDEKKIEQLHAVLSNAYTFGASNGVRKQIKDSISGKRETIKLPWYEINLATQALKPGTVTLLCGNPGAAKSLCLLQLCQYWHFDLGHDLTIFELEYDKTFHLMRSLAQTSRQPKITDESWVKQNPDEALDIFAANKEFLDKMGNLIHIAPIESVTLNKLAKWVDEQAKSGKRIICIDPITAAEQEKDIWVEDKSFINSTKKSIGETGASLVIVTHPKKGGGRVIDMDNLAGGACWSRFSQTILWLKNSSDNPEMDVIINGIRVSKECNRIMKVLKATNSYGAFHSYGMNLENLVLDEVGEIVKKKSSKKDDDE